MSTGSSLEQPRVTAPLLIGAVKHASASGDLELMKALLSDVEGYLANVDSVKPLATQLRAEIERLEKRS